MAKRRKGAEELLDTPSVDAVLTPHANVVLGPILHGLYSELVSKPPTQGEFAEHVLNNFTIAQTRDLSPTYIKPAWFLPGTTLGGVIGPTPGVDVFIINKIPAVNFSGSVVSTTLAEMEGVINLSIGGVYDFMVDVFLEAGFIADEYNSFYLTNLVKFPRIDAGLRKTIPAAWIKECLPLLQLELSICKPSVIVCMGTDASKKITGYPVSKAISNVFDYNIGDHTAKVVCINDPRGVVEEPETRPLFVAGFNAVSQLVGKTKGTVHTRERYHYLDDADALAKLVDSLIDDNVNEFAIDCEWGGKHYLDHGAALRTIQLAWSDKDAAIIILRRQHMLENFAPNAHAAYHHLSRLFQRADVKIIGHNISADYQWLYDAGLDLSVQTYFDTMLASHLFEPTMSHKLEDLATKWLPGWVRQDFALIKWLGSNKINKDNGYAEIPDELLHPYGGDDVISTYRLFKVYEEKLNRPDNAPLKHLFYEYVMPATLSLIEIEMAGVRVDAGRVKRMRDQYFVLYNDLVEKFRLKVGDMSFNPASSLHKQRLLFGTLGLLPVKTTDKPAMMWEEVLDRGLEAAVSPAVDGETLEILAAQSDLAKELYDISLLATVLRNQLPPPKIDGWGNVAERKGFLGYIKPDGKIHTRISQMLKTGRLASLDPNIMNIANRKEAAVQKVFTENGMSVPKLRSVFMAGPGELIVAADYKQAEIAALAYISGDENLIEAVKNSLDIHSVVAKQMFQLDCTLEEVKTLHKGKRISAKSIVFGQKN